MTREPKRIYLNSSTYVTREDGRLVMVRPRQEKLFDICIELLREVFGRYSRPKMKKDTKKSEAETDLPMEAAGPSHGFSTPPPFNSDANFIGPATTQSIMVPMMPQPGVYRFGNRQLALMPINPQPRPEMLPQLGYPYPQPNWMYPQSSNMGGFNYPAMGTDPRQFITSSPPNSEGASQTPVTSTKHICAECGRLRSRKYQHEHPLKSGEIPTPSYCKKCQKDATSTEESESSVKSNKKRHKKTKKASKKSSKSDRAINSSEESVRSDQPLIISKSRQKDDRNTQTDEPSPRDEHRAHISHRASPAQQEDDEEHIGIREPQSPLLRGTSLNLSKPTRRSQPHRTDPPMRRFNSDARAHRSSRGSVATNERERFHDRRNMQTQSKSETYETDHFSEKSKSNKEDTTSLRRTPSTEPSIEEPKIPASRSRSKKASRRRRLERSITKEVSQAIHPSDDDEIVVVKEHYVYRPRYSSHVQGEGLKNRGQDLRDETAIVRERRYQQFAAESDASDYYKNDWARTGEQDRIVQRIRPRNVEEMTVPIESHTSEASSDSYYGVRSDMSLSYLSRAASPPRPLYQGAAPRSQIALDRQYATYPSSEDDSIQSHLMKGRIPSGDQEAKAQEQSRTSYKPPYVSEATDRGTERAIMSSPKQSRDRLHYPEDASESTEEVERFERHVTFQEQDR